MTLLATLARLQAAESGRAVPLSRLRHRHLGAAPMVVIPLTLAGDPATPVAIMLGTASGAPQLLTVAQPRNRDLRRAFLSGLAQAVLGYIAARRQSEDVIAATRTRPEQRRYTQAPQLVVPNRASRDYLGLLGRALRFLPVEGPWAIDPSVPLLGKWLTFFAENADQPGSALLSDLTGFLAQHWATGQSPLEDANLAAQLAWIDPPAGLTGLQAALRAEDVLQVPPAGPATDPGFDEAVLQPLYRSWERSAEAGSGTGMTRAAADIEAAFHRQMSPTWEAAWTAVALLQALPQAPSADRRWVRDRDRFSGYCRYLDGGGLPQAARDSAAAAAARLARLEYAQSAYNAELALEDPYILAGLRTAGEAFSGQVISADPARTVRGGTGKLKLRPRFTVRTADPVRIEAERTLVCPARRAQTVTIAEVTRSAESADITLEVTGGMGIPARPTANAVPLVGEQVSYTIDPGYWAARQFPTADQTPWTHGGPPVRPAEDPDQEPRA
jgi:hypothetical protein